MIGKILLLVCVVLFFSAGKVLLTKTYIHRLYIFFLFKFCPYVISQTTIDQLNSCAFIYVNSYFVTLFNFFQTQRINPGFTGGYVRVSHG